MEYDPHQHLMWCRSIREYLPELGTVVECEICGNPHKYFRWSNGNYSKLCQRCVLNRPFPYEEDYDVRVREEEDAVYNEIEDRNRRDFGPRA